MPSGELVTRESLSKIDKIRKYYLKGPDSVSLTEKQETYRVNIYKTWNLLIQYHSREQAMQVMVNESNDGEGCSRATAYRYVNDAMSIFGNIIQNQHEAKKYIIEEDLKRLQQRAIKAKDGTLELNVIKQLIKLGNFDKDTNQNVDPEKLKAQTYVLKLHPSVLAAMQMKTEGGLVDFNMVDTEDIPFKEITEEEEDEEDDD